MSNLLKYKLKGSISRFVSPTAGIISAAAASQSYVINFPTEASSGDMAWVLTGLRSPSSGFVKAGEQYELRLNSFAFINTSFNVYLGLAKLKSVGPSSQGYEVISEKIGARTLSGISNSFVGNDGESPVIFTFAKDSQFEPDEYLYLMIGVKASDAGSPATSLMAAPILGYADYNNPLSRVCVAHNFWSRDVNSSFVDSSGILVETFSIAYGQPSDTTVARQTFSNYVANPNISESSVSWTVGVCSAAMAEICLVKK